MADFDPDKVTLHFEGCCSYSDSWTPGEPFPQGWGPESEARQSSYVNTSDYDLLLQKFKESREALVFIAKIKNSFSGGDWDEIQIARGCAKACLDSIAPDMVAAIEQDK